MEETLEQLQTRHRKENKELQGRITNKKKNATKKNRKGVNDECAELERQLELQHREELAKLNGESPPQDEGADGATEQPDATPAIRADDLAVRLDAATLAEPTEPLSTLSGTGGGGEGGKKRNRQKDRLARRAAAQEAAAVAAEAEAADMTDRRSIEKKYMLKEFAAHGLTEREIAPDGHCLFAAVADQLAAHAIPLDPAPGDAPKVLPYKAVRRTAARYMERHPDDYAGFLEEPLESYVAKIRDTAEWGGQLELSALANVYGVEIKVVQDGRTEAIRPNEVGEEESLKTVWLAYYRHGYGLGEHYNSLRKAP